MQSEGRLIRELIAKDHSLLDPWGDGSRGYVLSKTFLEGDKDQLLVLPKIWGPVQVIAKGSDRTKDLSPLSDLSRVGARAGMTTGATLSGPSLASWFLDRKLGEGYKDALDQSDWCPMFLTKHGSHSSIYQNPRWTEKQSWRSSVLVRHLLKVQRGPLLAGARPGTDSRRVYASCLWACLYGKYPGDEWDSHLCWH